MRIHMPPTTPDCLPGPSGVPSSLRSASSSSFDPKAPSRRQHQHGGGQQLCRHSRSSTGLSAAGPPLPNCPLSCLPPSALSPRLHHSLSSLSTTKHRDDDNETPRSRVPSRGVRLKQQLSGYQVEGAAAATAALPATSVLTTPVKYLPWYGWQQNDRGC